MVLLVAVRATLLTAEPMVILGPEAIASLKVTVTVILSPGLMVLSGSFEVMEPKAKGGEGGAGPEADL